MTGVQTCALPICDEVERSRDRQAELDFKPVTEAYLDVEREMRRVGDRDRVARD